MDSLSVNWKLAEPALEQVEVKGNPKNGPVTISSCPGELRCIGIGTDAAVFQFDQAPGYAFKVYSREAVSKKEIEESVYLQLNGSSYFPQYYGKGENYIVISLEHGVTLYDCLTRGIPIPRQAILDVEDARNYVRLQGLNPRDIHLKNVLLQEGRGKVIDVSEYVKDGNDERWEDLVWCYNQIYPLVEGKSIPSWMLETIKNWYYQVDKANFILEEFSKQMVQLFMGKRK